jgi:hypothetical protein
LTRFLHANRCPSRIKSGTGFRSKTLELVKDVFMRTKPKNLARVEQDRLLDEALEQTFPASDPIALQQISIIGKGEQDRARREAC